jgi:hypothetical protein
VPSGLWHPDEYAKLIEFDGDTAYQRPAVFHCHTRPADICAGWLGHRDPGDLLAVRIGVLSGTVHPSAYAYTTDVPLFGSGAEAAAHGLADVDAPGPEAAEAIAKLIAQRRARRRRR